MRWVGGLASRQAIYVAAVSCVCVCRRWLLVCIPARSSAVHCVCVRVSFAPAHISLIIGCNENRSKQIKRVRPARAVLYSGGVRKRQALGLGVPTCMQSG